jgi:hypothetical protein
MADKLNMAGRVEMMRLATEIVKAAASCPAPPRTNEAVVKLLESTYEKMIELTEKTKQ